MAAARNALALLFCFLFKLLLLLETCETLSPPSKPLKLAIAREYASFFQPLRSEFYNSDLTLTDPMNTLTSLDSYKSSLDTIGGRSLLGSLLFDSSKIILHTLKGGEPTADGYTPLETRWTLSTFFKPTNRRILFTGISVYTLTAAAGSAKVSSQIDYWDSVNLVVGGDYADKDRIEGVKDFVSQCFEGSTVPDGEVPYITLRRAKNYEVRRYPPIRWVSVKYDRREVGFERLGRIVKGYEAGVRKPCLVEVGDGGKRMAWAVEGGEDSVFEERGGKVERRDSFVVAVVTVPEGTPATIKNADRALENYLNSHGMEGESAEGDLSFCQFDEVFKMGQRRVEVWRKIKDDGLWDDTMEI